LNQGRMRRLISMARGQLSADLLLTNARIVNVFSGSIEQGNVAICGSSVAGIGDYTDGREIIDLRGKHLAPGFIDGHTHVESSLLYITEYARAVVPRGTAAIVTDLHEVANVCGLSGAREILSASDTLPLDVFFMVPSCVPATRLETAGAEITADDVQMALNWSHSIGLGEMMNFPGVLNADSQVLLKLASAGGLVIDGHAPALSGKDLNAYAAAGIRSDHESTSLGEAREKLSRGMWVMIREGSSEKNLADLLPLVNDRTSHRCLFVVDDRSCLDLVADGDMDAIVRKAIQLGLDPIRAIQMATINPAQYFGLSRMGAVAPGYEANLVVFSDLATPQIEMVFHQGSLAAQDGHALFNEQARPAEALRHTVRTKPFGVDALRMPAGMRHQPIIEIVPGQILTRKTSADVRLRDGFIVADVEQDILKLAVVERHRASGNTGLGLVKGFGLKKGALASSVAHDSHNVIAVGVEETDIAAAIGEVERLQGGLVIAADGQILASLPLPVAGLLSDKPLEAVAAMLGNLERVASELGCPLKSPFSILSFLALPVIPQLRLTDLGLVDVESFRLLP
jgi:adenine deaminase